MSLSFIRSTVFSAAVASFTWLPSFSVLAASEAVLEIDGKAITESDLPASVRNRLHDNRQEAFEKNMNELKQYAVNLALARAKDPKVDPNKLPPLDNFIKGKEPTPAQIKDFFEQNKAQLPPNATLEQFKPEVIRYLSKMSISEEFGEKLAELEKKGKFKILAQAPMAPSVSVDLSTFPAKGPDNAGVTLVEVSDYLCPHCQKEEPAVEALLKEFSGKVRFVQVTLALNTAGLSGELARGAQCARKQSDESFWKYHSKAFAMKFEQSPTADRNKVLDVAKGAGLDVKALEKCLATAEPKIAVEQAAAAMNAVGVSSTPTFFLNGRKLHTDHMSLADAVRAALDEKQKAH